MSMYLVWLDYKCLGYMGWETVLVTREKVKMMMFSDCFDQGLLGLVLQLHVHLLGMDGLKVLGLGYRGLETVVVIREEVNMMEGGDPGKNFS